MLKGRIHSIETMGLVDGPGIRTVVFFQGCKLRCQYCHNPDTWSMDGGYEVTVEELFNKIKRYKSYYKTSGGGVTLSGGDPILQPEFIIELLRLCKEEGIHTALDTSGYGVGRYDEILKYTDLVILDVKHVDDIQQKKLIGRGREGFLHFVDAVKRSNTKLWVRHVVVPGITNGQDHITKLAHYINTLTNVEKVELLPYHNHGENKYKELGMRYPLEGTLPLSTRELDKLYSVLEANLDQSIGRPRTAVASAKAAMTKDIV